MLASIYCLESASAVLSSLAFLLHFFAPLTATRSRDRVFFHCSLEVPPFFLGRPPRAIVKASLAGGNLDNTICAVDADCSVGAAHLKRESSPAVSYQQWTKRDCVLCILCLYPRPRIKGVLSLEARKAQS